MQEIGGRQIYAAAGQGHGVGYVYADGQAAIGQFGALMLGLPSSWSEPLFYGLLILVPLVLFGPAILRMAKAGPLERHGLRSLWRQGICVMLAYSILLTSGVIESLAYGTTVYDNLELSIWRTAGQVASYAYDDERSSVTERGGI